MEPPQLWVHGGTCGMQHHACEACAGRRLARASRSTHLCSVGQELILLPMDELGGLVRRRADHVGVAVPQRKRAYACEKGAAHEICSRHRTLSALSLRTLMIKPRYAATRTRCSTQRKAWRIAVNTAKRAPQPKSRTFLPPTVHTQEPDPCSAIRSCIASTGDETIERCKRHGFGRVSSCRLAGWHPTDPLATAGARCDIIACFASLLWFCRSDISRPAGFAMATGFGSQNAARPFGIRLLRCLSLRVPRTAAAPQRTTPSKQITSAAELREPLSDEHRISA